MGSSAGEVWVLSVEACFVGIVVLFAMFLLVVYHVAGVSVERSAADFLKGMVWYGECEVLYVPHGLGDAVGLELEVPEAGNEVRIVRVGKPEEDDELPSDGVLCCAGLEGREGFHDAW